MPSKLSPIYNYDQPHEAMWDAEFERHKRYEDRLRKARGEAQRDAWAELQTILNEAFPDHYPPA